MGKSKERLEEIGQVFSALAKINVQAVRNYRNFINEVNKDGALSTKIKELIGIAVAISKQCEFCVPRHVKGALENGATKEEIMEASLVAAKMGGGPSVGFIKYVLDALEDFET